MSTMMSSLPRRHLITADEYHRMAEVGLLAPDARVELIEGEIIDMAPIGSAHEAAVDFLNRALSRAVGDQAIVRVQGSVRLDIRSEPQPDLVLLAPRDDFYRSRRASAADTLLLLEVSDTTARYDRGVKVPLYARHAIPEVWLVDLSESLVTFFRSPAEGKYVETASTATPGIAQLSRLPGITIDLSRLLSL